MSNSIPSGPANNIRPSLSCCCFLRWFPPSSSWWTMSAMDQSSLISLWTMMTDFFLMLLSLYSFCYDGLLTSWHCVTALHANWFNQQQWCAELTVTKVCFARISDIAPVCERIQHRREDCRDNGYDDDDKIDYYRARTQTPRHTRTTMAIRWPVWEAAVTLAIVVTSISHTGGSWFV